MSNNPAKYEVLIKQYLRSILDIVKRGVQNKFLSGVYFPAATNLHKLLSFKYKRGELLFWYEMDIIC